MGLFIEEARSPGSVVKVHSSGGSICRLDKLLLSLEISSINKIGKEARLFSPQEVPHIKHTEEGAESTPFTVSIVKHDCGSIVLWDFFNRKRRWSELKMMDGAKYRTF